MHTVHSSYKIYKLKYITQDDVPTRSEIQQHLGTSLAQIIFDYNQEAVKLLDSIPSERLLQQSYCTAHDDQLQTDAIRTWWKKQGILKSQMHDNILGTN